MSRKNKTFRVAVFAIPFLLVQACQQRDFNKAKTKDLVDGENLIVTVCSVAQPSFQEAPENAKASVRVSCQGSCNGVDYNNRKFYLNNEERVHGYEISLKLKNGKDVRKAFVFQPEELFFASLNAIKLEDPGVQKAIATYAIDPAEVSSVGIPVDAVVLLSTGTKASLSNMGAFDGGTLDCGGKPIEGAIELAKFKEKNLDDFKTSILNP